MKILLMVLSGLAAFAVAAEPAHEQRVETKTGPTARKQAVASQAEKTRQVKVGKFTASGAAVKAVKSDNPLQLINPWAPM